MASVLLIQPPLTAKELFARGSKTSASIIPPLGLAYIAAYLMEHGHECRIIDGIAEPRGFDELCNIARQYDIVGITVISTYSLRAGELIRALREGGVNVPIVVGGPHVTVLPESLLEYGADYAVVGEGEVTMLELVECLFGGTETGNPKSILGLALRDGTSHVFTGNRPRIAPLDQLPLPARDLLPMHCYRSSIARASQQPSHSMLASRGCPGVCSFCSKKTFGTKVRYFSVDRIVEEFFLLRDKYGARDVAVFDDNFISDPEVVMSTCDRLQRLNFGCTWSVEARIDGVSREVLQALKDAGCTYIALGIESGSQRVLDHINKKITKKQILEAILIAKEVDISVRGYFMLGLPTETVEEMKETIRFAMELDVEIASFTLFVPLPGTLEYKRACNAGTFDPKYYEQRIVPEFHFLDTPVYVPEGMTAQELLSIHRSAYRRYYFRPKTLLNKLLAIRSPRELSTLMKGGSTLLGNLFSKK